jgi:isopentenyl-diphosphate Delta-isomerase
MPGDAGLPSRKSDHIRINLEEDVRSSITTGLEKYHFVHQALPELNLDEINLSQTLFGKVLKAPILISSMTGGTSEAASINKVLAECAQETGIAMGLGSQRAALEHPEMAYTYQVRQFAPDILLFANLGAIQLNYSYTLEHCKRAIDMVGADALILHLNALQEALQPEGDTRFDGLINKIEAVCRQINVPVIAKEVGWGISEKAARQLANAGIAAIDVAGAGGTSWSQVEMYRNPDEHQARIAGVFRDWGIPTAESIQAVRAAAPGMVVIASGGLRDGVDLAKCLALVACLGGMAGPFLKAAAVSPEETLKVIYEIRQELAICMFAVGVPNLAQLQQVPLLKDPGR